jgi:hypothetical protein
MWGFARFSTNEFVHALVLALGPRLKSAVIYGSTVAGDFESQCSDVNLLLVVSPLTLAELETIQPLANQWIGIKHRPPRLFSPQQLVASLDAFAIEWHDIHQARRILHGTDPFIDLSIDRGALRVQVERELHALVLALREGYLLCRHEPARLRLTLRGAIVPTLVLFRAVLRLFQQHEIVPAVKLEALRALAARLEFDATPFFTVYDWHLRRSNPGSASDAPRVFAAYLRTTERILEMVDQFQPPPKRGILS